MDGNATSRLEALSRVFTPHKPIDLPELLSGRLSLIFRATDAVNTAGLHLILFGDRGTGKTSLAKVLGFMVQEPDRSNGRRVLMASCSSSDNFTSIWRRVFQEVLFAPRQLGFGVDRQEVATHRMVDFDATDPNDVRLMVQSFPNPSVIVIDEFDRVPMETDARRLMADTIKLFSDTGVTSTIVLVGVADSIGELIAEHESISRNIAQIAVEPMTPTELADILRKGFPKASLGFVDGLPEAIAHLSQGYPHYTHLLGLWAGRVAVEVGHDTVTFDDMEKAIPEALRNAAGNVQQDYELAIASSRTDAQFEEVLLACALADKDSLGKFSATDVRAPLRRILRRDVRTTAYQSHLAKFCEQERGPILKKSGKRRSYRWRFVDPQVIPYIVMRGKQAGLISSAEATGLQPS